MNNKDETTKWRSSGAIELMLVLVFVCVNFSLNQETELQRLRPQQYQLR